MADFGVVLDTNVLYGMPVADTLLLASYFKLYKVYWSADIIRELERTMLKRGHTPDQAQRRIKAMTGAFRETEVTDYEALIPAIALRDPDDRHLVAVALRKEAELIVTYNLKHFPKRALATFNHKMHAKSPDAFLADLLDMYHGRMVEVLQHQARRIGMTLEDLMLNLEDDVPRFVADVRLFLEQWSTLHEDPPDVLPDNAGIIPLARRRRKQRP